MPREGRTVYTRSTSTRVLAAFYSDEPGGLNIDTPVRSHPRLGKIVGYTYAKGLGEAAGHFTLTIKKPRQSPRSHLRAPPEGLWQDPEDVWVKVQVLCDGQLFDSALGLIDTVGEDTQRTGSGQRAETYTINCRDIGKIFETTQLFVNFFHDPSRPLRSQGNITSTFTEQLVGTPAHFVRVLVETWLGNDGTAEVPWVMPEGLGGGPFFSPGLVSGRDRLALEGPGLVGIQAMSSLVNGEAIAPTLMQIDQGGGNLWDTMQEYSNALMNEMFVDLAPALGGGGLVPTLTLRERPFPVRSDDGRTTSASKWNRVKTHVFERGDVKRRQITKGGASNRFNYWKLRLNGIGTEGFNVDEILQRGVDGVESGHPGNIPIFNAESISRHGVRVYTASTNFVPFLYRSRADPAAGEQVRAEELLQGNFFRLAAAWLKKVHDWYAVAPFELSGTLATNRMHPEIRIGQRVKEQRDEGVVVYYVEQVSHRWSYPYDGETTLTVTRGEYEGDDLLDYVYAQYANPRALTAGEACFIDDDASLTDAELVEQLAAGCQFRSPPAGRALLDTESGLTEEFTVEAPGEGAGTQLEVERDGTLPRPSAVGLETALDDSLPEVGDAEQIPAVDAPPDAGDVEGQLQRQEPFAPLEGLDDVGSIGTDPIGGLDL